MSKWNTEQCRANGIGPTSWTLSYYQLSPTNYMSTICQRCLVGSDYYSPDAVSYTGQRRRRCWSCGLGRGPFARFGKGCPLPTDREIWDRGLPVPRIFSGVYDIEKWHILVDSKVRYFLKNGLWLADYFSLQMNITFSVYKAFWKKIITYNFYEWVSLSFI